MVYVVWGGGGGGVFEKGVRFIFWDEGRVLDFL